MFSLVELLAGLVHPGQARVFLQPEPCSSFGEDALTMFKNDLTDFVPSRAETVRLPDPPCAACPSEVNDSKATSGS